ncbi:MAG: hypothetical protein ACXWNF_01735, partial [Isosphaeraceae bacterium]
PRSTCRLFAPRSMAVFDAGDAGFWVEPRAHAPHNSPADLPGGYSSGSLTKVRNRAVCHLIIHPPPGWV